MAFFSPIFTIKPLVLLLFKKIRDTRVILTPRGDFTGGCESKKIKKYLYIYLAKVIGLYQDVLWHTTSAIEDQDVKKMFPTAETFMVPNLPCRFNPRDVKIEKRPGALRLVFVSRIFPKKNLKYALNILKRIKSGSIQFDVYGPMEDRTYWTECESIIRDLPSNIVVSYCGEVSHSDVMDVFSQYHAFFFPTLGENYGHVIVEAMMSNCICILSKGVTPWDDYSENGGFVEELGAPERFKEVIEQLVMMNQVQLNKLIEMNNQYITKKINPCEDLRRYVELFKNN